MTPVQKPPALQFGLRSLFRLTLAAAIALWAVSFAHWEYVMVLVLLCSPALLLWAAIYWVNREVRK